MNILVVVDMQKDFIDGALGTKETVAIVPNVMEKIKTFHGKVVATRDTHEENYLETQEGRKLPVKHCIRNTEGWEIDEKIQICCRRHLLIKKHLAAGICRLSYKNMTQRKRLRV